MGDSLKYILLGLGAYLLYSTYVQPVAASTTTTSGGASPNPSPTGVTMTPAVATLLTLTNLPPATILTVAQKDPAYSAAGLSQWQWNYYLNAVAGIQPDLSAQLGSNASPMPFATWWAAVTQWATIAASASQTGLSGLGCNGRNGWSGFAGTASAASTATVAQLTPPRGYPGGAGQGYPGQFGFADMSW